MKRIIPKSLQPGDNIRIIAPSISMGVFDSDRISRVQNILENNGYTVGYGKRVYEKNVLNSSSIGQRLSDISDALDDDTVKMILPYTGGYNINQLLPYLDFEKIKHTQKIWCGYSDITVILNAIYAKTGLITYLGPNADTLQKNTEQEYTLTNFIMQLSSCETHTYSAAKTWSDDDIHVQKNTGQIILNPGKATGTIIGGNLCSLNLLQGTEYMPPLDNAILFIEDDPLLEDFPQEFERNLHSVLQQKDGMKIAGICIGRFQTACNITQEKLETIFSGIPFFKTIPIVANLDFGHTLPMTTIPIGGTCTIDASKDVEIISWKK